MDQNAKFTGTGDTMGATVVITHRVRDGRQAEYEEWMNEIGPLCRSFAGNLDWQIIHPVPGFSSTYTIIIRFDTGAHLRAWTESQFVVSSSKESSRFLPVATISLFVAVWISGLSRWKPRPGCPSAGGRVW